MEITNFPKTLYVGRRNDGGDILGFAVPDGTDAAAQKRKETVDHWSGKNQDYYYAKNPELDKRLPAIQIENTPITGFKFDHSVTRYETSNKWFRINDPRGFQLEITAHNLSQLLQTQDVLKGEFQGQYLWGRIGAINHLISISDERYVKFLNPVERKQLEVGDMVESPAVSGRYIGTFYVSSASCEQIDHSDPDGKQKKNYYSYGYKDTRVTYYTIEQNAKPYLVFVTQFTHDPNYRVYSFARKLSDKAVITPNPEPLPELPYGDRKYFFHKTKDEQNSFSLTQEEINDMFHKEWKNAHSYYGDDYYDRHYKHVNYPLWPTKRERTYT
jgi:hypothetical protein